LKIKYGEWVYGEYDMPHCSECGYMVTPDKITSMCPECNTVMEEDDMDKLAAAIEMALNKYSSDYIDVVYNEMLGYLDVVYCSDNNSFPIFENVANVDAVDKHEVAKMCDDYYVGLVW